MKKVIIFLGLIFVFNKAFSQMLPPITATLSCSVPYSFSINNSGYVGISPTISSAGCNPCCYLNADLDGDGLQDVPFSVENSVWFQFCNTTTDTITVTINADEKGTGNLCNIQGAVWVGDSLNATTLDCENSGYQYFDSNVSGAADGWTFNNVVIPTGQCAFFLVDSYGGAICDTVTMNVTCPCSSPIPAPIVNSPTICKGETALLQASGANYYVWSSGKTTSSITVTPTTTTSYTVTASISNCSNSAVAVVSIISSEIYGKVIYSSGSVIESNLVLYEYLPYYTKFDTVQITQTDTAGNYHFTAVANGKYLLKVFPAINYITLAPTYYGNQSLWRLANVVNHDCSKNDTLNISAIEITGTGGGNGNITGEVYEGWGYVRNVGDPIKGVDIKLQKNSGDLITNTITDVNGIYSFANIADGNYTVYADIAGLKTDSVYIITLNGNNNQFTGLNYTVDSISIFIDTSSTNSIVTNTKQTEKFSVYPNPSTNELKIKNEELKIEAVKIYSILGEEVFNLTINQSHNSIISIDISKLSSGVYFVTLVTNGKTSVQRLVISE